MDDEPQITRVLRTSLNAQGYEIRVANDGETALEILKDFAPDLVITDLAMPNMNGIELCRQLRKISQVPILVLSVRGEERSKIEALDSGRRRLRDQAVQHRRAAGADSRGPAAFSAQHQRTANQN